MQAPMEKRRLFILLSGIAVLGALSWWRMAQDEEPPLPPQPASSSSQPGRAAATAPGDVQTVSGQTMGTTYTVKYVPKDPAANEVVAVAIEGALLAVVETMSTYEPSSEISKLNRAPKAQVFPVSPELMDVLQVSAEVHRQTNGAFDITVRPLVSLYGFGSTPNDKPPDEQSIAEIREHVGMHLLEIDPKARTLQKLKDGVEMDLGGVAKGYGVDQVARALDGLKIDSYMVEVGGEIRVKGAKSDGRLWKLAIETPSPSERSIHGTLTLERQGAALATSGDYRNFRQVNGKRVSHTFDPRTLSPTARRTASVSIVRPTAVEADALATALSVLSAEEAIELANERGWAVYLLVHDDASAAAAPKPRFIPKKSRAFEALDFTRVSDN